MRGVPPDACPVERDNAAENVGVWPGRGVLLLCAAILAAGYGFALLRGPAPVGGVEVIIAPVPEAEAPAVP